MNELQIPKLLLTSCQTITGKTKAFEHLKTQYSKGDLTFQTTHWWSKDKKLS